MFSFCISGCSLPSRSEQKQDQQQDNARNAQNAYHHCGNDVQWYQQQPENSCDQIDHQNQNAAHQAADQQFAHQFQRPEKDFAQKQNQQQCPRIRLKNAQFQS